MQNSKSSRAQLHNAGGVQQTESSAEDPPHIHKATGVYMPEIRHSQDKFQNELLSRGNEGVDTNSSKQFHS